MFNNKFRIGVLQHPGYNKGKGGGGSAPAQPTQTTSYTTNIPEYAQPYVENMLNATQAQIYDSGMGGFKPYVPYSTSPTDYIASFSPLQQQAQSGAANLNLPANYGLATGQTLGTGMQLGALAPQMGGAGLNYALQATNPLASQAYMSPYIQSALAPQLAEARRQYDITGQQQQSQAARSGAFGGSREALMAAENRRNMNQAMNQMIGQGYQNAFNQAQQAQQFGANLGLQGQQAQAGALAQQLAAANQLAGLGGQQLQAQQGIFNLQNQLGQQQQQQQQNIINQAVQNYATAQQYPFMQLGILNSMLRGLPMQQSSTQMYQAPPSAISQLAGLGTAGLGALGMYNQAMGSKAGGLQEVKKMAAGGNAIPMKSYSDNQLQGVLRSPASSLMADIYAQSLLNDRAYMKANPLASNLISQQNIPQTQPMPSPQQMAMAPQTRTGLDAIGTGDTVNMAGGGLLAFADGDLVPVNANTFAIPRDKKGAIDIPSWMERMATQYNVESPTAKAQREALEAGIAERKKMMGYEGLTRFGLGLMAGQSPYALTNVGAAGKTALDFMSGEGKDIAQDRTKLLELASQQEKDKEARETSLLNNYIRVDEAKKAHAIQAAQVAATREANILAREATTQKEYTELWANSIVKNAQSIRDNAAKNMVDIDEATVLREAYNITYQSLKDTPGFQKYLSSKVNPPSGSTQQSNVKIDDTKPAPSTIAPGTTKVIDGKTYEFDGKGWMKK